MRAELGLGVRAFEQGLVVDSPITVTTTAVATTTTGAPALRSTVHSSGFTTALRSTPILRVLTTRTAAEG